MRGHRPTAAAVAAVAVLVVMAAGGCAGGDGNGGGSGGGPLAAAPGDGGHGDPTGTAAARSRPDGPGSPPGRPPTALAEVRGAADTLIALGSARTRTAMETAAGGTRVTIRGEGGYDFRRRMGRLTLVLPEGPAGTDVRSPVTELLTPGALYMKNRGAGVPADKWVRVDTTALPDGNLVTGGATDPLAAAELLRGAGDLVRAGEERFAGIRVRHYRGTADIGRAAREAREYARDALSAAAKGFTTDTVPFDVYLDEEGRLRGVRHRFTFAHRGGTSVVVSTTVFHGFGTPVPVRLPDRRDMYTGRIRG
ncbi:lipoprotein [Streptomyces yaizuensis]|uniref:Lipoprotein n=1 Tax=Streptomyces yaizuensis TaxID=2989713 RepID=A0ABQ5PB50_9ACTN|nr:lipoprotein [Streptomyces sp. YSPA8]